MYAQGKAQKRPVKTLSLHIKLILGTETPDNNQAKKNNNRNQQITGKGENLFFRATTWLFSNVYCSTTTTTKQDRKVWPIQREKIYKNWLWKYLNSDTLDKDFKTIILKMLKELKEDVK